ncbi:MAG TPA: ABC transporter permease [Solirubrobacteraceae bacterium]|jgi:lipopolysaccharide transport system permease protein|nr:ABC transporter permease [Solirubrobacteraceae bacterium]
MTARWEPQLEPSVASGAEQRQQYVVDSEAKLAGTLRSLRETWSYRDVMLAFASRSIRVKYKQAAIGLLWVVLQPLSATLLFTLVVGKFAHVSSEHAPYLLFALCGMTAWQFLSEALTTSADSVVADSALLRKVYFPREILPVAAIVAAVVDLAPSIVILIIFELAFGYWPTVQWLALPLVPIALIAGALAYGLLPAALNVYYRDVRYVLPFLMQLGLFLSPVIYSLSSLSRPVRDAFIIFNPAACAIDGFRRILLHHEWPQWLLSAASLGWCLLLALVTYTIFKKLERTFSDRA